MKSRWLALLLLLPVCAEAGNARIAALARQFEGSSLWSGSSFFPWLDFPEDASTTQVLSALWKTGAGGWGSFEIVAVETCRLVLDRAPADSEDWPRWALPGKQPVTAVLIRTDEGEKIVFMHYGERRGWRTSVYDAR